MNENMLHDQRGGIEEQVSDWLEAEAGGELPDWLLRSVFDVTRREPQQRGIRRRLVLLASDIGWRRAPADTGRIQMITALRLVVAAIVIVAIGTGVMMSIRGGPQNGPGGLPDSTAEAAQAAELFEVTLPADAIPERLAGILVFRKIYPTDLDISYVGGFIPPNTFVRYVESGELGIRPRSETQILRAGSTWDDAEVVAADEEAIVGPGDTFVMHDVPWAEYGPQALGEMWTPGEDARVVGFAIRESSRCCSMTHTGMRSPWYHTLASGVEELRGEPVTLRMMRWDVPVGAELPPLPGDTPTLAAVDIGKITGTVVSDEPAADQDPMTLEFLAGMSMQLPMFVTGTDTVHLESTGTEPAVVYQLIVEPAADTGATAQPAAAISVTDAGRMARARSGHEATLLQDGRVLISGGGWADAELFDPATGTFEPAGKMARIRSATATLLDDGRVLLAGGGEPSAEIFDPDTLTFEPTGPLTDEHTFHTSTLLADGRVLIAGGGTRSAELYDPASGTFEPAGEMLAQRAYHAAVASPDGGVLISGGGAPAAERYDPATGGFQAVDGSAAIREHHTLTILDDGRVLIVGHDGMPELYDPATGTFETIGSLVVPRYHHAAALLPDGRVLIIGGMATVGGEPTSSIEVFDPATGAFAELGSLQESRWDPTATTLEDGRVLVTGGSAAGSSRTSARAEIIAVGPAVAS